MQHGGRELLLPERQCREGHRTSGGVKLVESWVGGKQGDLKNLSRKRGLGCEVQN